MSTERNVGIIFLFNCLMSYAFSIV